MFRIPLLYPVTINIWYSAKIHHSILSIIISLSCALQGVLRKDIQGGEMSLKVQGRHAVPQTINFTFPRRLNLRLQYLFHCNISSTRTRERWHSNPQPIASLVFPKVANSNIDQTLMHILSEEYALLRRISYWSESLNRVPCSCLLFVSPPKAKPERFKSHISKLHMFLQTCGNKHTLILHRFDTCTCSCYNRDIRSLQYSTASLTDSPAKITAGVSLRVLQWLAFSFSAVFSLGIATIFKSTDGTVKSAGSDVEKELQGQGEAVMGQHLSLSSTSRDFTLPLSWFDRPPPKGKWLKWEETEFHR